MQSHIESGAQLLARLNAKPSLHGLDDTLFLEGPGSNDIIEINGERSTGKTFLVSQMLAKCILPKYYQSVRIKGCNASAILINTDHHFQVSKLIDIMTDIVDAAYTASPISGTIDTNFDKIAIVRKSLRNLYVIDCYNSEQFFLTLRTLDDIFLDNAEIAILAIDSITAYYWQDRESGCITIDSYVKKLLQLIRLHTTRFDIATVYTTPRESNVNCKGKKFLINDLKKTVEYYRIHLQKMQDTSNFMCTLETEQTIKKMHYSILLSGIKWKVEEGEG
ncbi:DNA repair protein XRCC2-like [Hylaeus anthracinus]|uniref:DNA repair protein XRCC2-like n=1 Tax=Hylaeus anthracinus TaxID=313031 RepID=UPI0023B8A09D|nr:DNA repair protein XRCC2-like [Hylaeus anthracinus]